MYENKALTAYKIIKVTTILKIASKSIPPVFMTLAMMPSDNFVVAFPKILGPIIEKIVAPIENNTTIKILK